MEIYNLILGVNLEFICDHDVKPVQTNVMAWCQSGNKPLFESIDTTIYDAISVVSLAHQGLTYCDIVTLYEVIKLDHHCLR